MNYLLQLIYILLDCNSSADEYLCYGLVSLCSSSIFEFLILNSLLSDLLPVFLHLQA
jgi:hypothetical protein